MPRKRVHARMARPAQPRHVLQLVRRVPAAFDRLGVHEARDQVVVAQGDPVAAADLAARGLGGGLGGGGGRGGGGQGGEVGGEDWGEEVGEGEDEGGGGGGGERGGVG